MKETPTHSLLEITLFTGRKNQIRVHLADQGCPVADDKKYGPSKKGGKRLALHAAALTLTQPFSREEMTFTACVPAYFESLIKGSQKLCNDGLK